MVVDESKSKGNIVDQGLIDRYGIDALSISCSESILLVKDGLYTSRNR